jgi:hypothetical protein
MLDVVFRSALLTLTRKYDKNSQWKHMAPGVQSPGPQAAVCTRIYQSHVLCTNILETHARAMRPCMSYMHPTWIQ